MLGHTGGVLDIRFLSNGMQLMSSATDGLVKLWNIRTTDCVQTMDNHDAKVWSIDMIRKHEATETNRLVQNESNDGLMV